MADGTFSVVDLKDSGDARGSSFGVPAELFAGPFPVMDMHAAMIEPGAVRGNHYHALRREVLVIMATDRWSLHWDEGADTPARQREFTGPGAVLVVVPEGMSHAIRNDGTVPVQIFGMADGPYDLTKPDVHPRSVVSAPPR